jgi:hypothetical protein
MLLWMGQRSIALAASLLTLSILLVSCAPGSANSSERWRVQHYKMPCLGEGPRLCYLVARGPGEFEYFYDEIEGFEYRWGFSHEITVTTSTQPAVADGSTLRHRLVSLVEQQRAAPDATFSLPVTLDGQPLIEARQRTCSLLAAIDIDTSEQGCAALRSRETALFRHHPTQPKLVPVDTP